MQKLPPVLITSLCATGVAVARALQGHGIKIYGTDLQFAAGCFSKFINRPNFGYRTQNDDNLLKGLIEFSNRQDQKPVLFPTNDKFIEFVGEHYEMLKHHYIMQKSLRPVISKLFLDKKNFYELCTKYDVSYPKTIYFSGSESFEDVVDQIRFPIILKPHLIHKLKRQLHGEKVIFVKNIKDFEAVFGKWRKYLKYMLIQEVIEGDESDIWIFKAYFDENGKLLDTFTGRKIRQYPPVFGSACLAESAPNHEVARISIDFLTKVKFQGLCGTEFKFDHKDNEYKMIEINIRPQTWDDLMRIAGKQIIWEAYCDLIGLKPPPLADQKQNVKWSYLTRDVVSALWHMKKGNLRFSDWINSYKGLRYDAILDKNDLKMVFGVPVYTFYQFYQFYVSPNQ